MDNQKIISKYWAALEKADGKAMAKCYAKDATFRDPVFNVKGDEITKMWHTLMNGQTDIVVTPEELVFDADKATGKWVARYTYSPTGRRVENHVQSTITASGGKIVEHTDAFSLYSWTRQALGARGLLLGWTPLVQNRIRKMGRKLIES